MNTRKSRSLTLEFQPTLDDARGSKELRDGLSAVLQIGSTLWVANDESASVERLKLAGDKAADHVQFELRDYLDLAVETDEGPTPEIDIEGMDWSDGYLWVVGSHSLKRCNPDPGDPPAQVTRQLARVETDANRYLLARIPLREQDGLPVPVRKEKPRRAQRLRGGPRDNALTRLLRKDKHLGAFLGLPGKDNGFDIEGMAVAGERVFLGLRGPVLRGWAVVLELRPGGKGKRLELQAVDGADGARVRKHFLDLGGLGVRDLCLHGDDLLVLAGPTMALDGPVRVLRWRGAARSQDACVLEASMLETVLEVPFGTGCDHAEGLALLHRAGQGEPALLVVYDSPAAERQAGASSLRVDLFPLPAT